MTLKINTNIAALNAHRSMVSNDSKLSSSLERLSTGLRINKAADDASGMAIADSLRAQSLGIGQAVRNANDGISMVQTADGAIQESINIVNTIKTKAIQAASDSQTTDTRKAIQADIDKLMEELDVIARTTSYNGQKLLSGVFTNKDIQIGAYANETASISIGSTESTKTGHITTAQLALSSNAGGETQLTITSAITGEQLTLSKIDIQSNNSPENGMGALADEINRYTSVTGISGDAVVATTTNTSIQAGTTGNDFAVNGIAIGAIDISANDSTGALVSAINGKTTEHGVSASMNPDGTMTMTSTDGRAISVTGGISDVMGTTPSQMSTLGYINLTQSGTSQFQISGIGAGATGGDIDLGATLTTVEDSFLAAGSSIATGSTLTAGSVIGGNITTNATISNSQLDFEIVSGSTLESGSIISDGTILGGMVETGARETTTGDMFTAAGSRLESGSLLGTGTVLTMAFTVGGTDYEVGDTLTSDLTLDSSITLQADMTLAKDSQLATGSALAAGTVARADVNVGADAILSEEMVLKAGSTLVTGTVLLAGTELGDSIGNDATVVTYTTTELAANSSLATSSILAEGSTVGGRSTTGEREILDNNMTLTAGSTLESGSLLAEGTIVTLNFTTNGVDYKAGDVLTSDIILDADLALSADMTLAEDSELATGSILSVNTANAGTIGLDNQQNLRLADISVLSQEGAQFAISIAESALADLDETRSNLGSVQNQLSSTIANLSVTKTNIMASESTIRDIDFAAESMTFSNLSLLAQTGSYALAQANASAENIMSLLQ